MLATSRIAIAIALSLSSVSAARADVMYSVYSGAAASGTLYVQFSVPDFLSGAAETPTGVSGQYATTFDTR